MGIGRVVEDYTSPSAECPFVYQSNDFLNCKLFLSWNIGRLFSAESLLHLWVSYCFPQGSTCVKPKKKTYSTELNFNGTTTFSISAGCKPEDCSENARYT